MRGIQYEGFDHSCIFPIMLLMSEGFSYVRLGIGTPMHLTSCVLD